MRSNKYFIVEESHCKVDITDKLNIVEFVITKAVPKLNLRSVNLCILSLVVSL